MCLKLLFLLNLKKSKLLYGQVYIFLQKNKPTQVLNNHSLLEEDNSVNIDEQDPEMVIKKRKKVFLKIESFNSANEIYIRMLEPVDGFLYSYR